MGTSPIQKTYDLTTLVQLNPSKSISEYPVGIFPVIWSLNVTIGSITATANLRGFAVCNGSQLHAIVTQAASSFAYIVGVSGTSWTSARVSLQSS